MPGTAGHAAAQEELLARVREAAGEAVWTQEFPVLAPVVTRAELILTNGPFAGTHPIFPIWPDLVRLKATPAGGIAGRLVYVGSAALQDLPAHSLRDQIAVMEMSAYDNWKGPFAVGAAAVLLLGSADDRAVPPAQQALYQPRYYLPEGPVADALRKGTLQAAVLHCDAEWRTVTARNILALVKPAASRPGAALPPVALAAPYDSMSVVMGLAPGADSALDAAFLLGQLRQAAAAPPARPVLFCFVDAYGFNQLGMRQLLALFTATPDDSTREDYQEQDLEQLTAYRLAAMQVTLLGKGPEPGAVTELWDKSKYRELQRCLKDTVARELLQLKEDTGKLRLTLHQAEPSQRAALQKRLDDQAARIREINAMLTGMLIRQDHPATNAAAREWDQQAWGQVRDRVFSQLANFREQIGVFERLDGPREAIRQALGAGTNSPSPVAYLIGIDLSDAGVSVGPGLYCGHLQNNEAPAAADFLRWLKPLVKTAGTGLREEPDSPATRALNVEAITSTEDPGGFAVGAVGLLTAPATSFRLPAVTWMTLDGARRRVDTPQDRAGRLDWGRIEPQAEATRRMLARLQNDPEFPSARARETSGKTRWRMARGVIVTESVGETVPRTPAPGLLVTLVGGDNTVPGAPGTAGIRRHEFAVTGPDGGFRFAPFPGHANLVRSAHVEAFRLDGRGRIVQALSDVSTMIAGRVASVIDFGEGPSAGRARGVAFDCQELNGPEFFDARYLEPLSQYSFLDVRTGGAPKRHHFSLHEGQMFGLVLPDTRWQLLLRAGAAANRLVLLNLDTAFLAGSGASLREGLQKGGYRQGEPLPSIPAHLSARDVYAIDEWRMSRFRAAGIGSRVIEGLHADTKDLLAQAAAAEAADDGAGLHRHAASALANEIRAYEAVRALGDDVTRGAIFLMILLVPFAVAMERLLFACRSVGRRITTNTAIFTVMTAVLWSFHPSFRITAQPMIILMAFSILLLSLLVIVMILRKFEADMEDIRSGHAEASGAQTGRGGVIGSAVWLGIANMRKRKLRTALTATTIMLITFALLCFASSTHYQNRRQFKLPGAVAPTPGVLLRLPGMRPMQPRALATVANLLAGERSLAARYWWANAEFTSWRLHARNPLSGRQLSLKAALGLMPGEREVSDVERMLPNWERFAQGGACYLSAGSAQALGLKAGDRVVVAGADLELAGIYDSATVENRLRMLDGQSLLPYDYTVEREENTVGVDLEAKLAAGIGLAPESGTAHVPGDDLVILPAELAREAGGDLRSLALRAESGEAAERVALGLTKILAFPVYYGAGENVKVVVATPLIPRPPRNLLVPLAIAALIIFNTMLNSVAERKKEIHIYTSLGLAPRHVGILFLAESATYGLMGSVFGYIVGQGVAKILTHFDLMGGITLNYSGSNVVMTMGMVMGVVLVSAIVPAIMAGKLATPSKEMKWKVPEPVDGVIRDLLPFTVTRAAAGGLAAFIHDFVDAHTDGGIGAFTADEVELLPAEGARVAGVRATAWLSPYDLGVRQGVRIEILEDVQEICNIRIELTYESGQVRTWWRLNRTFLDELRRQLLGWRKVKPERVLQYIRQAEEMAAHA